MFGDSAEYEGVQHANDDNGHQKGDQQVDDNEQPNVLGGVNAKACHKPMGSVGLAGFRPAQQIVEDFAIEPKVGGCQQPTEQPNAEDVEVQPGILHFELFQWVANGKVAIASHLNYFDDSE